MVKKHKLDSHQMHTYNFCEYNEVPTKRYIESPVTLAAEPQVVLWALLHLAAIIKQLDLHIKFHFHKYTKA